MRSLLTVTLFAVLLVQSTASGQSPASPGAGKPTSSAANKRQLPKGPLHPDDAVAGGGHFYKVFAEKLTWTAARKKCEETGGYLVCIETAAEDKFIIDLIEKEIGVNVLGTADKKYWMGGGLVNGRWFWLTGAPIQYKPHQIPADSNMPFLRHAGPRWLTGNDAMPIIAGYVCEWNK